MVQQLWWGGALCLGRLRQLTYIHTMELEVNHKHVETTMELKVRHNQVETTMELKVRQLYIQTDHHGTESKTQPGRDDMELKVRHNQVETTMELEVKHNHSAIYLLIY